MGIKSGSHPYNALNFCTLINISVALTLYRNKRNAQPALYQDRKNKRPPSLLRFVGAGMLSFSGLKKLAVKKRDLLWFGRDASGILTLSGVEYGWQRMVNKHSTK